MNKKLLLIPVAVGLIIFIIAQILKEEETGNKFEIIVPNVTEGTSEANQLKGVNLFLDNSGSIKGFLDFARMPNGNMANATFISTLSNFMDRIKSSYNIEPLCYCGGTSYNRSGFLQGMENFSIFRGAVTELHQAISDLVKATTDSTIAVFASDMILSYGKNTLTNKGKFYNKQQLEQLGAYVHDAMTDAKGKDFHALLVQYYGDFNGQYYYNYTENIDPNIYRDSLMRQRPYYILAIGKEPFLKSLAAQNVFLKPAHIYATFDLPEPQTKKTFEIQQNDNKVAWIIGNPDPKYMDNPGTIMSNADFGDAVSTLKITYPKVDIPFYINVKTDEKLSPVWDEKIIQNVTIESSPSAEQQVMIVTLNPHNKLKTTHDVTIRLCSDNEWVEAATTLDDTKNEEDIRQKTWGFSTIVNNINKVYRKEETLTPETIAKLSFNIIIK